MQLTIYRNAQPQAAVTIDEQTVFTQKLMGEHKIVVDTIATATLGIQLGDYISYNGENYYINSQPSVEKINNVTYRYIIKFEGEIYFLFNKLFLDEGAADFSYHGSPTELIQLLLTNINSIQTGWNIANVEVVPPQTLFFSGDSCRTALTKIAESFEMEYRIAGKSVYLQKSVGQQTTHVFEYGRGKGLYTLKRTAIEEKNLVTRVFGFGAKKNIDESYRNGRKSLVFEELTLEANQNLYGIREAAVTFDDVYPSRTGVVSAIALNSANVILDNSINFDINNYLIEGTVAKIVFKTGDLAGYEFEIKRYLNNNKSIEFITFAEENGYELPNNNFKPAIGDEYTLVDIGMPQTYIDAAEATLKQRTQEYLDENSTPRVTYAMDIDQKYVREHGIALKVGDLVGVQDESLGIDANIRVTEVSYPLVNTDMVTVVISNTIPYTVQERLIADTIDNNILTKNVDIKRAELARKHTARFRQMQDLVFDPDGYFDAEKIKPLSVETLMLSVGAKSKNFGLSGITIQPNYAGNANYLNLSAGQLVHYEIEIEGLGYIWQMSPTVYSTLVSGTAYYVYAKCSKTALSGTWYVSSTPKEAESEAGHYLFNMGVLYAVNNGRRDFDFTNGMTFISGDTITTGTIQSLDGLNFFDLNGGRFKIGDNNSSLDWNVSTAGKLTLKGSILQTAAGEAIALPNYRGDYTSGTVYYPNDTVSFEGQTHINISPPSGSLGLPPTNLTYWKIYAAKGADGVPGIPGSSGPGIVFTGPHSNSVAYYNNAIIKDVVYYGGVYYGYIGTNGAIAAFNIAHWESFGAQFNSVATNLLLAENANIGDWIIKKGKISSQQEFNGSPKAQFDGNIGRIVLKNGATVHSGTGGESNNVPMELSIDSYGGIRLIRDAAQGQPFADLRIRPDHISISTAKPRGSGDIYDGRRIAIDANVTANQREILGSEYIAAVYGSVNNTENSNPAAAYGGYFKGLYMEGPFVQKIRRTSGTVNLSDAGNDYIIICTGTATVNMPPNPKVGRSYVVKRTRSSVNMIGNPHRIYHNEVESTIRPINNNGQAWLLVFDGVYWQAFIYTS